MEDRPATLMFNGPPTSESPRRTQAGGQDVADAGTTNQSDAPHFICLNAALQRLMVQAEITVPRLQFATLEGAPGTGKHLFAQNMHRLSDLHGPHGLAFQRRDAREWLANDADASARIGTL